MNDPTPRRRWHVSVALLDQLLSSGSNVVLTFGAARLLGEDQFGVFSFGAISAILGLSLVRAAVSETLLVRLETAGASATEQMRTGLGAAVIVALPLALLSLVAGVVATLSGSDVGPLLIVLGVLLPFLFVQDTIRYVTLVSGRATTALATDALWLAGVVATLAAAGAVIGLRTPLFLFGAWCVTGALAGLVVVLRWRTLPRPGKGLDFLRSNKDMAGRYTLDTMALTGSSQVSYYLVTAFAGLSSLGAVRGAQALFGPLNVLFSGLFIVVVPEANRARSRGFGAVLRICVIAGVAMVGLGLGLLAVLVLVPNSLGEQLLGDTWLSVSDVLVPIGLASVMNGAAAGAMIGLKAIDNPRAVLAARMWSIPPLLALPAIGAVVNGAVGMSWGLFVASALTCGIFWIALCRSRQVAPHTVEETVEAAAILDQEIVISSVLEGIITVDMDPDDIDLPEHPADALERERIIDAVLENIVGPDLPPAVPRLQPAFGDPMSGAMSVPMTGALPVDDQPIIIDLNRLENLSGFEAEMLNRYLLMIQRKRQDPTSSVLTIRKDDLRVIATIFGIGDDAAAERLDDLGLGESQPAPPAPRRTPAVERIRRSSR